MEKNTFRLRRKEIERSCKEQLKALNKQYTEELRAELDAKPLYKMSDNKCLAEIQRLASDLGGMMHRAGILWDKRIKDSDMELIRNMCDRIVTICEKSLNKPKTKTL